MDQPAYPLPAVEAAIASASAALLALPGVHALWPGLREHDLAPAVVAGLLPGYEGTALPAEVGGFPLLRHTLAAHELLDDAAGVQADAEAASETLAGGEPGLESTAKPPPKIGYAGPKAPALALRRIKVGHVTCHVGPDSGWSTLQPFLAATQRKLTVAMYELHGPHVIDALNALGSASARTLDLILQVDTKDDHAEQQLRKGWQQRLTLTPAVVDGPARVFKNSYHSKIAVRDGQAVWLSSGNWNPSSQPDDVSPNSTQPYAKGNREWHVVVESKRLAALLEGYIEHDIRQAREAAAATPPALEAVATAPARPDLLLPLEAAPKTPVQQPRPFAARQVVSGARRVEVLPLFSPDNYAETVLGLIRNAKRSIALQFAYIRLPDDALYGELIEAVGRQMREGPARVRVLAGGFQNARDSALLLARHGWRAECLRMQTSWLHNKGILIDGEIAVVGSHNWSRDGTQFNRDASLVFFDAEVAAYYGEVFDFDWQHLSKPILAAGAGIAPQIAGDGPTPPGMVRVPWSAVYPE